MFSAARLNSDVEPRNLFWITEMKFGGGSWPDRGLIASTPFCFSFDVSKLRMEFREVAGPTRKVVLYGIEAVAYAKMALQTTPEE